MPSSSDRPVRPRARVLASWLDGWRRALGAPAITAGVLVATLLAALPLAIAIGDRVETDLDASAEAVRAAEGWNAEWAAEFGARAQGVARTFTHEIIGFGGTLATASRFVDAETLDPAIGTAVAGYIAVWLFLWGGILDRFARQRPIRGAAFFAACGVFFGRFLRLALLVGPINWALFLWVHPLLFDDAYDWWTRDLTSEREAAIVRGVLYLVFLALLALVGLVTDFAKIRAVVEDRHSMVGAALASLRFVRGRLGRLSGLYLLNVVALTLVVAVWSMVAPAATAPPAMSFLLAQIYLLLRIWTRLALAAAEVSFFQAELAHATYSAAPLPNWPDSPTVEGLRNLTR